MNYTDEQIIKAMECCIGNTPCGECPMLKTTNCMHKVFGYALDLFNRLKAENELLQTTKKLDKKQITELKQHILKLQHILISFMNEVENWEHKHNIDTSKIPQIAVLGTEKGNIIKQIKSEARKEFAERLKKKIVQEFYIDEGDVNNLLEEMEKGNG